MTVTVPEEIVEEVDRRSANRSAFVVQALRLYLDHLRREELQRSLANPHADISELADEDLSDWVAAGAEDAALLDPHAGRRVRWRPGAGWR